MVKFNFFKLLFIVLFLVTVSACSMKDVKPVFLNYKVHANYPSGSTISYLNGHFYIMGDDASEMLVLNEELVEKERIGLFEKGVSPRISKTIKADIESSAVIMRDGKRSILLLGSGSLTPHRDSAFLFNPLNKDVKRIDFTRFYNQLRIDFKQLNIEAATILGEDLVLGIRANTSHPDNYIVIATPDISQPKFKLKIQLKLPVNQAGISGMDYDDKHDILFITFSSENTSNAYDDGEVGESYLAIIDQAKEQLQKSEFYIPSLIKLTDLSHHFRQQKIESVSLITGKRELLLVADDDKGGTRLFRLGF